MACGKHNLGNLVIRDHKSISSGTIDIGPQLQLPPDRPKFPKYMNSDFSLLPKAKTFSDDRRCLIYLNLPQEVTVDLYWFSTTGKSVYRLSSVNKNQHIFRHLIGCSDCTN